MSDEQDITDALNAIAPQYQIPVALARAICLVESSMNPWAFRYEPTYRYVIGDKLTMTNTEKFGQMCSWGLMQVMGGVAREYGFPSAFPMLCHPSIGILYGCRHLHKFFLHYTSWTEAIAAYNAGRALTIDTGEFINQLYVNKVQRAWQKIEQDTSKGV